MGIDILTVAYCGINLLYLLIGWNKVEEPVNRLLLFLFVTPCVYGLALLHRRFPRFAPLSLVRYAYPAILFTFFFEASSAMNRILFQDYLDPVFIRMDMALFGYLPSLIWGVRLDNFAVQELMHAAYFSFYAMIAFIPILLYVKKRDAFHEFLFALTFTFYFLMLMYTLFPVIGGRYFSSAMEICTTYRYGLFTRAMALIYTLSPHHGGAFPSSHVAIAIICNIALGQYRPRYGWYLLPVTILLCVSTVYCHYHYAVDVAAGVVSGFGLSVLSSRIYVKRHAKVSRDLATTNLEFGK